MHIFLARIPPDTTKQNIIDFIGPTLKGGLFPTSGTVVNIKIEVIRDKRTHETEYHAIVIVEPQKTALKVIQKLNRTKLKGKPINVRQYHIRNRKNDRRVDKRPKPECKIPRMADRRRDTLELLGNQGEIRFESHIQYSRKLVD